MNTLVVGSSHVNSLVYNYGSASANFGNIQFWTSSIWSILACGTKAENGLLRLGDDPMELLSRLSARAKLIPPSAEINSFIYRRDDGMENRVPLNIRDFFTWDSVKSLRDYHSWKKMDAPAFLGEDVDVVIAIFYTVPWIAPDWVARFENFDPACPISMGAANNIVGLGGSQSPPPPLNWGPHVFGGDVVGAIHEKFSLLEALEQLRGLYPKARKVVCVPPPPFAPERPQTTAPDPEAYRGGIAAYREVLSKLYRILDFETCFAPVECLDRSGMYTKLEFSFNPEKRDSHMNAEYGNLLWRDIQVKI